MVELIEYNLEVNNSMIYLSYSINGNDRNMRVNDLFKEYILENHEHHGINEVNYNDFIAKKDVKYKLSDEYLIQFIEWFHNI